MAVSLFSFQGLPSAGYGERHRKFVNRHVVMGVNYHLTILSLPSGYMQSAYWLHLGYGRDAIRCTESWTRTALVQVTDRLRRWTGFSTRRLHCAWRISRAEQNKKRCNTRFARLRRWPLKCSRQRCYNNPPASISQIITTKS